MGEVSDGHVPHVRAPSADECATSRRSKEASMAVDPSTFHFQLPREGRPRDEFFPETWYPGVREIYPSKTSARRVNPVSGIVAVVIHATAGGSAAGAVGAMRDREASFHWLVPAEREEEHGQVVW